MKNWWKELESKVKFSEPLWQHTTFRIGAACDYFIEPKDIIELKLLIKLLKRYKISFQVLGSGSNVLVCGSRVRGAVVHLAGRYFKKISFKKCFCEVGAGCRLSKLISSASRRSLTGHEFLMGIPGTVGGALMMNAGKSSGRGGIGDFVEHVKVMDRKGRVSVIKKNGLKFGYRKSNLRNYIILEARLRFSKGNQKEIMSRINEFISYRKSSQDCTSLSAGCIFKNPGGKSAGRLIDLCGLKGVKLGGASVSRKHANFIINQNNAKAEDVLGLMKLARKKVKNKFGINLKPEIKIWGL